ncbi:hypothetical protein ElyMa_001452500 [Elysia marginata]|uniref:Uncharacterized protein n=1 Tax=Elysia marginata TaxID=1093978 RepID=A0AAV4J0Z3_9GAST|nr:hypothetical protein ElyMa_001452500 [Elysia marginata]
MIQTKCLSCKRYVDYTSMYFCQASDILGMPAMYWSLERHVGDASNVLVIGATRWGFQQCIGHWSDTLGMQAVCWSLKRHVGGASECLSCKRRVRDASNVLVMEAIPRECKRFVGYGTSALGMQAKCF